MARRHRAGRIVSQDFAPGHPSRFQKGISGNPGGRSSAAAELARRIRERTSDGLELIDFAIGVLRGTGATVRPPDAPTNWQATKVPDDPKSRMFALDWLSERGWGKSKQDLDILIGQVELTPEQRAMLDALRMSPHERRERIEQLRQRMLGAAAEAPRDRAGAQDADDDVDGG